MKKYQICSIAVGAALALSILSGSVNAQVANSQEATQQQGGGAMAALLIRLREEGCRGDRNIIRDEWPQERQFQELMCTIFLINCSDTDIWYGELCYDYNQLCADRGVGEHQPCDASE